MAARAILAGYIRIWLLGKSPSINIQQTGYWPCSLLILPLTAVASYSVCIESIWRRCVACWIRRRSLLIVPLMSKLMSFTLFLLTPAVLLRSRSNSAGTYLGSGIRPSLLTYNMGARALATTPYCIKLYTWWSTCWFCILGGGGYLRTGRSNFSSFKSVLFIDAFNIISIDILTMEGANSFVHKKVRNNHI